MSDLYVIDTNVYIQALRSPERLDTVKRFLLRAGLRVRVDGIVAMELRAGGVTPEHVQGARAVIEPYQSRGWAGARGACLGHRGGKRALAPSMFRDALLAASCREAGAVLVTNNAAVFLALQKRLRGFRFTPPWPPAARG